MSSTIPRLVIAAASSGSGKTTITAGIISALTCRGYRIQPFKIGPDYIDPSYHSLAAGRACRNLDSWMLPDGRWKNVFDRAARDADGAIIEGVMGLYDGANYEEETGSTAEIAKGLEAPVVIVLDISKVARTAGALALGLLRFDQSLNIAGFILNRAGSPSHGNGVARSIEAATGKHCFGWIPRDPRLTIAERHLGLIPTGETNQWQDFLDSARTLVEEHLDVDELLPRIGSSVASTLEGGSAQRYVRSDAEVTIAVARDEAFSFIYPENLELLEEAGARIVFFSPLHDEALPTGTDGIILSGGFPEVYAASLSGNQPMISALKAAHANHLPILAECGGLMYLTESIRDLHGDVWSMAGILPEASVMTKKLTLGYRIAEAACDGPLLSAGERIRGHEFHYSSWENRPASLSPAFILCSPTGRSEPNQPDGVVMDNLLATYVHTHFLNAPHMATRFVSACLAVRKRNADKSIKTYNSINLEKRKNV